MRTTVFSLALISLALLSQTQSGNAQSPTSYPWCAVYDSSSGAGGSRSCYYTSYEQCMTTILPIGGYCIRSPYYQPSRRRSPRG